MARSRSPRSSRPSRPGASSGLPGVVIVDTNVLAYFLIEGDRTRLAQTLYARDPEWRSEAFVLIEFSNILATYVRNRGIDQEQALSLMGQAELRVRGLINLPNANALRIAGEFAISAYDARFIAVARQLGGKLVTEDMKLRAAAPALTQTIEEALAN